MKALFFLYLFIVSSFCADLDRDGFDSDPSFGAFQDCCDSVLDGCFDPFMVNPGAYEIPNNGILDRCVYDCPKEEGIQCQVLDENNIPCDFAHVSQESYILSGSSITSLETEPAVYAIDICEFKDDDDDPSWGFYRQRNMVFALANQTRQGFDAGIIGPDLRQASVLESFGRIGPYNGKYMMAISSGIAQAGFQDPQNNQAPNVTTSDTQVNLPIIWTSMEGPAINFPTSFDGASKPLPNEKVFDSILSRFSVVQPTNMNAFSFKVLYLDYQMQHFTSPFTSFWNNFQSYFLAIKSGNVGVPSDGNFAIDINGYSFNSYNPNINYYTQCNDYVGTWPYNTCYNSNIRLEKSNYQYATNWIPIGTSAAPNETYELQLITFDAGNGQLDTTVLIDDFKVISEARASHGVKGYISVPYGYQYTGDIALVSLLPDVKGVYPANTKQITFTFVVRNEGPEISGDVTISFTPPFGTKYNNIEPFNSCTVFSAEPPFEDNSYYKCKLPSNEPLLPHKTMTGTLVFDVKDFAPKDIHFRVTATTSSIDTVWGNNHLIQLVYIAK